MWDCNKKMKAGDTESECDLANPEGRLIREHHSPSTGMGVSMSPLDPLPLVFGAAKGFFPNNK